MNNEFQHLGVQTIGLDPNDAKRVYVATAASWVSEFLTVTGLAHFLREYPDHAPKGLAGKLNEWAKVLVRRSDNLWDFRKLDDKDGWTPMGDSPQKWNEPGNVMGLPAPILAVRDFIADSKIQQRLDELTWSHLDDDTAPHQTAPPLFDENTVTHAHLMSKLVHRVDIVHATIVPAVLERLPDRVFGGHRAGIADVPPKSNVAIAVPIIPVAGLLAGSDDPDPIVSCGRVYGRIFANLRAPGGSTVLTGVVLFLDLVVGHVADP